MPEKYLAKGFNHRTAEYFADGRKKILSVEPGEDFKLILAFDNGELRSFDIKPIIEDGTVFAFLADPSNFRRVYLDDAGCVSWDIDPTVDSNMVWSNKVDLSSDTCYLDSELVEVVQMDMVSPEKEQILAWDPDFTKVTPEEAARIKVAEESGFISEEDIDWDNLSQYAEG